MSFKHERILLKTFVEPHFEVMQLYEFQAKANFYKDICWVSVWSYLGLQLSKKTEFLWRHLLSRSLKLSKFTTFNYKRIFMKTFVESQFQVMLVCEFQTKANSYEDIYWASLWSYVTWWVSNKTVFLWRYLFDLSLKLCKFTIFKKKWIYI